MSQFSTFNWICLLFILLILLGVELPLCIVVTILHCYNLFSGVKLSIRSFCFIFKAIYHYIRKNFRSEIEPISYLEEKLCCL